MGNYHFALQYLQNGLAIANEIQDEKIKYKTLEYLGITYGSLEEHQLAIEVFNQSLEVAHKIGFAEGEAIAILGMAYRELGEYQKSRDFFEENLKIAREMGVQRSEGDALYQLGITYPLSQFPNYLLPIKIKIKWEFYPNTGQLSN